MFGLVSEEIVVVVGFSRGFVAVAVARFPFPMLRLAAYAGKQVSGI